MKKMTKALALLTVMAMLATLFVAAPASATVLDDAKAAHPSATVFYTSDDAGESLVDPDTLPAGSVFYAWVKYEDLPTEAYIDQCMGYLTWDADVVALYDTEYQEAISEVEYYDYAVMPADFDASVSAIHQSGRNWVGRYVTQGRKAGANGIVATNIYGYGFLPALADQHWSNLKDADTFLQANEDGTFVLFGMAFTKLTDGKPGVTVANQNKTLNGKEVTYASNLLPEMLTVEFTENATTIVGEELACFTLLGTGTAVGVVIDNSPRDSEATEAPTEVPVTEAPTEAPTEVPVTEAPTEAPTEVPEAQGEVTGVKEASNSVQLPNAFFYQFTTPVIPGEVTGLTATFQIDGKDAANGSVNNVNLTGISNVALKIAAIVKNIPEGQETTPVTTNYTLNYSVAGVAKTLQWSRTDSLN